MTPARLRRAAHHLAAAAKTLRNSYQVRGAWLGDAESMKARREHDELIALSRECRDHAKAASPARSIEIGQ